MLFDTQIKGRMGSPRMAGSTRRLSSGHKPRIVSATARRPPPERRTWPFGSGSASRSSSPRLIVERASPVIRATTESRPILRSAPRPPQTISGLARRAAADRVPAILNAALVDHATGIRLFAEIRNPQAESNRRTLADHDLVIVRGVLKRQERPRCEGLYAPRGTFAILMATRRKIIKTRCAAPRPCPDTVALEVMRAAGFA